MTIFVVEIDTETNDPDSYGPFNEYAAAETWADGRAELCHILVVEPPSAYPGCADDQS